MISSNVEEEKKSGHDSFYSIHEGQNNHTTMNNNDIFYSFSSSGSDSNDADDLSLDHEDS